MNPYELEKKTREIASLRWGVPAQPEHIGGIDFDCVLHLSDRHWIIIEITSDKNLEKIRGDIEKRLIPIRRNKIQDNVFIECYIVLGDTPTHYMVETAHREKIDIYSFDDFKREFFDYKPYVTQRNSGVFGSAFDPNTGKADTKKYIKVKYKDSYGKKYTVLEIAEKLVKGEKIILLGNYGTGKSRCTKEVFNYLSQKSDYYTFSINLRDNWGLRRKAEILRRHFEELGLSNQTDNVIRLSKQDNCIFLLDGFDEIGILSWSTEAQKLKNSRKAALQGVRDMVETARGGVLITGREQYFNDEQEMKDALGVGKKDHILVLYCPEEFTEEEMREYLVGASPDLVDSIPDWIPKKPLTYNVLSDLSSEDINQLNDTIDSHLKYWYLLIHNICAREAKIRDITLEPSTILKILKELAHYIFLCRDENAIITPLEMEKAFHRVLGYAPDGEAAIILQRLPGLGRVSSEGADRVFCDYFLLNCLKASYIIDEIENFGQSQNKEKWKKLPVPDESWKTRLDELGHTLLQEHYELYRATYERYAKRYLPMKNLVLSSILLTVIISCDNEIDFKNKVISFVEFDALCLTEKCKNIVFSDCFFKELDISSFTSESTGILLKDCYIVQIVGIGDKSATPTWIQDNCVIDAFQSTQTISDLRKRGNITTQQMILLTTLERLFFQKGSGRLEKSLFRGFDESEKGYVPEIINLLVSQEFVIKIPSNGHTMYIPARDKLDRVNHIRSELTLSSDQLWLAVSSM